MLTPSLPSVPSLTSVDHVSTSTVADAIGFVQPENLWRFAWLSVLLVLFFPSVREPVTRLWAAIFKALAIPFLLMRAWFDSKFGAN